MTTMKQLGVRPRLSSSLTAPSCVNPITSGICTSCGPLLTTRLTVPPFSMTSPASGSCRMIFPFSTVSLYSSVT